MGKDTTVFYVLANVERMCGTLGEFPSFRSLENKGLLVEKKKKVHVESESYILPE